MAGPSFPQLFPLIKDMCKSMALNQLTDVRIRSARPDPSKPEYLLADGGGLYLRVRRSGAKDWLYVYTFGGKRKKLGLGSYEGTALATARQEAAKARDALSQLIDPQGERKAREAAAVAVQNRITVNDLFERWRTVDLVRRKDGGDEVKRMFEKDVLPKIGRLAVEDVRKGHVTGVTDALLARGVTRMAKLIFSLMRQMFRYAVDRDIIEFDPTASIRKAKIGGPDNERDRALSEDEIKALVDKLGHAELTEASQCAVWLCLATCCRIGELLSAKWEHVDLAAGRWWIPPENSKNGKAHTVHLSVFSLGYMSRMRAAADAALVEKRKKTPEAAACPWVFPNRRGDGPLDGKTVTKQIGDRQRDGKAPMKGRAKAALAETLVLPGGHWTPHDLRRTGATMMVALGALPEVAERCLNHVEANKVKRIYQRHSYEKEMREAWRLLGARLDLLTRSDASNVVTLKGAA